MQIQIRARDIKVTRALRAHVELRLGFALSRFGEQIGRVAVHLSNSEEHHSKPEKRCQIVVGLRRSVKVQETDADVFAAVARAAARAARSVTRMLEQEATRAELLCQPLDGKKLKSLAALPLRVTRRADTKRTSLLKRKSSSSLHRKLPPPLGA